MASMLLNGIKATFFFLILILLVKCQPKEELTEVIYANQFDQSELANIEGGKLFDFNGDWVIGPYNRGGFNLDLSDIPKHDFLEVTFTLLLHDSWDGNAGGDDGPDRWYMELHDARIMDVTFSNSPCVSTYCLFQSYPDQFPDFNDPKTGASYFLPGLCHRADLPDGTSVYQITKTIAHTSKAAFFRFYDRLVQTNSGAPACDESWSMSSLQVKAVRLK
ncbi:hypothetical protein RT717_24950 [Imperialibacter roseus]|uniref:Lipoprotein n=1 Tax=Imperialibacter roseus TaxID=1324217 RepID=A0ABZ0IP87_9BACT|nr:hypothetical protein [Imperialibacter roseus]WOK06327.1 hypothetical protein RT717_24950 [Imperialibacter roseus]